MHPSARLVYPMGAAALLLPVPVLLGHEYPLLLPYEWHKVLHVVGAVLFLGNVATGALWGTLAILSRDRSTVGFALGTVNWSDAAFTGPGVLLTMYNGLAMAGSLGGVAGNRFTLWGLALLVVVVVAWLASVVPDQHRIQRAAEGGGALPGPASAVVLRWNVVGGVAGVLAFAVLALMVLKP